MAITLEQAKKLERGTVLHHATRRNADGTPQRWRVNGKVKTWKTQPNRVQIPVKHGLRDYNYVTENELEFVDLEPAESSDAPKQSVDYSKFSIRQLAGIIKADWKNVYFGAVPYLDAMMLLEKIEDRYIMEDGRTIVLYFLSNAKTWRGDVAKAVKAELNRRLK